MRQVEFPVQLKAYGKRVDQRLAELLPPENLRPVPLSAAMRYACLSPGKRIRPILCLAAAEAVGSDIESVLDAACALEMVHAFSLIHDDLPALDNDDLRRGRPTCHVVYGEAVAILAGDGLFALAFETILAGNWPAEAKLASSHRLAQAASRLVRGETEDILAEGEPVEMDRLRFIHANKTGALVAAAAEIGARLGGASETDCARVARYGEAVGLAFQIADDILNVTSTPEALGKSVGSDAARGKATYPGLVGLEGAKLAAQAARDEAIVALEGLPGNPSLLREIAEFSISRVA